MDSPLDFTAFRKELASIFAVDLGQIQPGTRLAMFTWDSLAVVSTILVIDELFDVLVEGQTLVACETIGDIEQLVAAQREP